MAFLSANLEHPREMARFLYVQRVRGFQSTESVGLDQEAREAFLALLGQSKGYLEFGSGGSTVQAARLGVRTLSVEADRFFAAAVRRGLPAGAPVEIMEIDLGLTREWSRPIFTFPSARRLRKWRRYSSAPFDRLGTLGWFPDLVLVDGRFRRACALQAARETLRNGRITTLMVDDYFGREIYRPIEHWLGTPQRIGRAALFDVRSETTIEPDLGNIAEAAKEYE